MIGSKPGRDKVLGIVNMAKVPALPVPFLDTSKMPVMPREGSITSKLKLSMCRGNRLSRISGVKKQCWRFHLSTYHTFRRVDILYVSLVL